MPLEAGATLHERYQIVRPVTAGAMGSLYEAHDLRLDGPCAVKEMHATRDAWVYRRFKEEATLLSRLNHPDIPKVRDFFLIDDIGYIVMDFVRGSNLLQEVTAKGRRQSIFLAGGPPALRFDVGSRGLPPLLDALRPSSRYQAQQHHS